MPLLRGVRDPDRGGLCRPHHGDAGGRLAGEAHRRLAAVSLRCGAIVPLPALWIVSSAFGYLLALQLVAGVAWGCYELATFLLFFETIAAEERVSMLSWFNAANALVIVVGAALGATLLGTIQAPGLGYLLLFGASSASRLLSLAIWPGPAAPPVAVMPLATRIVAVRPGTGGIERPVLPGLPDDASPTERKRLQPRRDG